MASGQMMELCKKWSIHDMEIFFLRDANYLTKEEWLVALSSPIFMKEKQDGKIKGRTCNSGLQQWEYIKKEDVASPPVPTDSVFITGMIDIHEEREVVTCNIQGAFLHTVIDEKDHGAERKAMWTDSKSKTKTALEVYLQRKDEPVLCMQLYKLLYRLMRLTLLFYKKLKKELTEYCQP